MYNSLINHNSVVAIKQAEDGSNKKQILVVKLNLSTKLMKYARKKRVYKMKRFNAQKQNSAFEIYSDF